VNCFSFYFQKRKRKEEFSKRKKKKNQKTENKFWYSFSKFLRFVFNELSNEEKNGVAGSFSMHCLRRAHPRLQTLQQQFLHIRRKRKTKQRRGKKKKIKKKKNRLGRCGRGKQLMVGLLRYFQKLHSKKSKSYPFVQLQANHRTK
jgi:hypothetical protein